MLVRAVVNLTTLLAAGALVAVSALADLRSPEGTERLGAMLADDPAIRGLVGTVIVDALLEDAAAAAPDTAALLPLARPMLAGAAEAALAAPAGRAALATTLTDAARQLTFAGPVVLDLRNAALAAADATPEPLATLARAAAERSGGTIVLGAEEDAAAVVRTPEELGRIAGLPATVATTLAWTVLVLVLLVGCAPGGPDRPTRLRAAGRALLLVGAPATLLVRLAPELVLDRVVARATDEAAVGPASGIGEQLVGMLPPLVDGLTDLVARTADVALALAGLGLAALVIAPLARDRQG